MISMEPSKSLIGPRHPMEVHVGTEGRDEEGSDSWLTEELLDPDFEEQEAIRVNNESFERHRGDPDATA